MIDDGFLTQNILGLTMSNFLLDLVLMDIDELNAAQQPLVATGLMITI